MQVNLSLSCTFAQDLIDCYHLLPPRRALPLVTAKQNDRTQNDNKKDKQTNRMEEHRMTNKQTNKQTETEELSHSSLPDRMTHNKESQSQYVLLRK